MRRFLLAVPLLLTLAVSSSDGGYVVIRIILEGSGSGADPGTGGAGGPMGPGAPSGMGGPKGGPMTGGSLGGPPKGGSGGSLGPPSGGGSGGSLGPPPPSGGGSGSSLGPPPGGGPTSPGGQGGSTGMMPAAHTITDPSRSIVVVVPFTTPYSKQNLPFYAKPPSAARWDLQLRHPFGRTNLLIDNTSIELYHEPASQPAANKTFESQVLERRKNLPPGGADAQPLLDLIGDALDVGMAAEAAQFAEELVAAVDGKKLTKVGPQVERFLTAYRKVQKPLNDPSAQPGDAELWRAKFDLFAAGPQVATRGHYSLIYWDAGRAEVDRRLTQLENNFKAFYLWFAVRGIALQVPAKPLNVVLARTGQDLRRIAGPLEGLPMYADAFYSAEYDLVVLSPERIDGNGLTFQRQAQQTYAGANRQALVAGDGPPLVIKDMNPPDPTRKHPDEVARMQTWAMVERYMEEESELSGVSREATRQLYHAAGILPRHVALPEWLSSGSVGFFHRPKGPVFNTVVLAKASTTDFFPGGPNPGVGPGGAPGGGIALITGDGGVKVKHSMTVGLTTGYGAINYVHQKHLRDLAAARLLNPDPAALVRNVLTDAYFTGYRDGIDPDPQPLTSVMSAVDPAVVARKKREALFNKSHATSWALFYFLAKTDLAGLYRYTGELNRLPRDLPIDETTRLLIVARAFNLSTGPNREAGKMTFADFGQAWLKFLMALPTVGVEIPLNDAPAPAAGGGAGGPGGAPGGPMGGLKPGGGN